MGRRPGPQGDAEQLALALERVVDLVRRGAPKQFAFQAVGVCRKTWGNWLRAAREGVAPYDQIMGEVLKAEGEFFCELMINMHAADEKQWVRAAWRAERQFPAEFSLIAHLRPAEDDGPTTQTDEDRIAGLLGRWEDSGAGGELEADGPIDVEWTSTGEGKP